ncbi:hypothetical protein H6G04_18370 [Calothrix membranacea FACHB-236]|nr:hypothetical protein [Calothrix membranacea FACHB-236]
MAERLQPHLQKCDRTLLLSVFSAGIWALYGQPLLQYDARLLLKSCP